ncbi:LOW QUALITY PROTEIN: proliferation marker protein Ki-67 [Gymnodraco acuticeps]|uniref:LOW QUALITY PROTEIN: proliferation marker protein Ki-67 n=1 Tax=Gymnodraco acuticeps TaxID=8218 RepID=A0A6P8U0G7_GYMAC|nr:LOW QUALITY PROTEIN: proliferation marker protein Ki-67 [Gymnodraco acuticeps]
MPLHGKIVVIKRSGGDGTEFPLTGTCLFGRVAECDIRIQLPHVSKEHCRIDLNENKEVVLTNLSSTNPTRVNGEALQQSERLKNGDVITIIDRSFRFEYPPAPTPKKRSSRGGLTETLKVHQDQQVGDKVSTEVSTDPHLKDGTNQENIHRSLDKTMEVEPKQDSSLQQSKTASPFGDLYQMIKQSLDVKTPGKSSASVLQTPTSRFCTPRPVSVRKNEGKAVISTEDTSTPQKEEAKVSVVAEETKEAENVGNTTPKSAKKQRRSFQTPSTEMAAPEVKAAENAAQSEETTPQKRVRTPPQRFTCEESPVRRRSKEATPAVTKEQEETSPITEKVKEKSKKRKSGEVVSDMPGPDMKRKRVSFGSTLCPELFDKRLPPDSPLRKGATPRVSKTKNSLLRRASASGLLEEFEDEESPAKKKTPAKKSPKSRTPSPKAARGRSSSVGGSPAALTPSVQGRFSVSRIITPSPGAEDVVPVAPKVTQRRRSTSRDTPICATLMRRRSGISRASMKVNNSWADIVRFGPTKHQVFAPVIHMVTKKTTKAAVPKPQTPARNIMGHVSTGHADSPVTIVVGRAQQRVVPTGAAPRLVPNLALLKKNMKMDEDFTGISEMLKTPAVKKRSVINENNALKTPVGASVVEPSVLNTPEESGEMMVSPLTVSSSVKGRSYNSEAVQRLLNDEDEESSCISELPVSSEQQCTDLKTSATTPKQKPELPECLTGVKRIKKTPKQKSEPIEDLRGKILKTPKQKREQQEDCLTGVKQMMATPKQEAVEDIKVELLTTPNEKVEQQEAVVEVVCETPQKDAEPIEDLQENVLETPKAPEAEATRVDDVEETEETPVQESEEASETTDMLSASSVAPAELVDFTQDDTVDYTCCEVKAKEPQDDVPSDVKDVPEVNMEKADANDVVDDIESSDAAKTVSEAPVDEIVAVEEPKMETVDDDVSEEPEVVTVDEKVTEEQPMEDAVEKVSEEKPKVDTVEETASKEPKVETASEIVTEMDTASSKPDQKKKSVRGRRTKTVEPEEADGQQEAVEQSEEPVIPTPSRGRRVKNTEAAASSAVKQIKRGRDAKSEESQDVELPVEESEPLPTKAAPKPKRGSAVKKASEVQEVPLVSATNSLKRVGKGNQAAEEKSDEEASSGQKIKGGEKRSCPSRSSEESPSRCSSNPRGDERRIYSFRAGTSSSRAGQKGEAGSSKARHSDQRAS